MSIIAGLGDLLGAFLGSDYMNSLNSDTSGNQSVDTSGDGFSYPPGTAALIANSGALPAQQQQYQQLPQQLGGSYAPQTTGYQMVGQSADPLAGASFPNSVGGMTLGANTNTAPVGFNYPMNGVSSFSGGSNTGGGGVSQSQSTSYPVQLPALPPTPEQQYQAAVAQLGANAQNAQVNGIYGQMYGLAGTQQAGQQVQNQIQTDQAAAAARQAAISGGYANTSAGNGLNMLAISQGAQRGANIAANGTNEQLGVLQGQAQYNASAPAPVAPGQFQYPLVNQQANTLFGTGSTLPAALPTGPTPGPSSMSTSSSFG